jgi:hypothetical protein
MSSILNSCEILKIIFIKFTLIKMSHCCGKFVTLNNAYKGSADNEVVIRENWMNGPVPNNFTGCSGPGWNAGKAPCKACDANSQSGSRICNSCRVGQELSSDCGGTTCAYQPSTNQNSSFYF